MKLNNKGFTLVELLAVIVILLGLAGITLFGITNVLEKREEDEKREQTELACGAAKIYFSFQDLEVAGNMSVNIQTLKDNGYFSSNSKTDKIDGLTLTINKNTKVITTNNGIDCP